MVMHPGRTSGGVGRRVRRGIGCGCSVLGLLFGLVFLVIGLVAFSSMRPYEDGLVAVGTVVDVEVRGPGGDRTFYPVVSFVPAGAEEAVLVSGSIGSSEPPEVGSTVEVSYQSDDPSAGRVITSGTRWFPRVFLGIGGFAVLLVVGGIVLSIAGSQRRSEGASPSQPVGRPPKTRTPPVPVAAADPAPETPPESDRPERASSAQATEDQHRRTVKKPSDPRSARRANETDPGPPREGWYPDPDDANWLRWWDGSSWTDDVREA